MHSRRVRRPADRVRTLVVVVAVAVMVVTGCSGDDDVTAGDSGATETTATGASAFSVGEEYVRAFAREGERTLEDMIDLAAPGSVADRYARHTQALNSIQLNAGEQPDQAEVTVEDDTVVAEIVGSGDEPTRIEWSDFEVDGEGRLTEFTINGVSLGDRLAESGESDDSDGVVVTLVSGFRLVTSDSPVLIVEFDNGADDPFTLGTVTYVAPDGTELPTGPSGPGLQVPVGETNRLALVFDPAEFGGTLVLGGEVDGQATTHELDITA